MVKRLGVLLWQPVVLLWAIFTVVFIVSRRDYSIRFWLGMAIAAIGISLWALARVQLGSSFSVSPQARRLVTTGLYSKFRNPIYLFGGVRIVGLLVALGNWTLLVVFLALNSTATTDPSSVVVYVDSNTQQLNTTQLAVGNVFRFKGSLFNDSGTLAPRLCPSKRRRSRVNV